MGDKANLVALLDLSTLLTKGLKLASESGAPLPIDTSMLKDSSGKASYIGFSLILDPEAIRARTIIPVEQIETIAKNVKTVISAMQGGGQ